MDLSTFSGLSPDACLSRLRSYSPEELADEWRRANPQTPDEIVNFYRNTDLYVWELMQWHASESRRRYWDVLREVIRRYPADGGYRRVYDFGCGVGTDALFLVTHGYKVTLVDVDGPTWRFAQHRFARRGLKAKFVASSAALPTPDGPYDIVVSFDVLEHVPDPLAVARRLVSELRDSGVFVHEATFHDDEGVQPCHLAEGIKRFAGLRWHIHMAGLGLRQESGFVYRKITGGMQAIQKLRYRIWQLTGLWVLLAT